MKCVRIHPRSTLRGEVQVPGDKSISHRAVMLSALAEGKSTLRGLLLAEDILSTIGCFREMGVKIEILPDHRVEVYGVGLKGLKAPTEVLNCGNSGTTLRLMMGILAGQPFTSRLTGDASLNRRPVERVTEPLKEMGAEIEELRASEVERVIKITGRPLRAISYSLPVASAQVKSAILLAGLYAQGNTQVVEPLPSRDHTEVMLAGRGIQIEKKNSRMTLIPPGKIPAMDLEIPRDISSAAFFLVAGALGKNSEIFLKGIGVNPTRSGVIEVLKKMGAKLAVLSPRRVGGEEVADLKIHSSSLSGTRIAGDRIPRLIDEIPILMVAAASAQGKTEVRDAAELRVKESDRIQAIAREWAKLGVPVKTFPDGLEIQGPHTFHPGTFQSGLDHRIAMSLSIAATQAPAPSIVEDVGCVDTSYPGFFAHLKDLGVKVETL